MSYLSISLNDALQALGLNQTTLAKQAGITQGQTNRACRGRSVKVPTIHAIARAVPEPHRSNLVASWLKDQVEPDVLRGVLIHALGSATKEEPVLPAELDPERRALVLWVANEIIRDTAMFDMLRGLKRITER